MLEYPRNLAQRSLSALTGPTPWVSAIGTAVAVGVAYFLAAELSLALLTKPEGVAVFWPAAGVAVGAIVALGPNARLPVAVGTIAATLVANLMGDRNLWSTILFALCNAGEAVFAAWLIQHSFGSDFGLGRLRHVLGLLAAAIIAPALSGIGGAIAFKLFHDTATPLLTTWQHWVASDGLGILTVAPLLTQLGTVSRDRLSRSELGEGVLAVATLATMSGFAIFLPSELVATVVPIALLFPPLLWLAARCKPIFAAAAAFIVSVLIVWTTTFGVGYFGNPGLSMGERVLAAQASVVSVTLGALVLAALFAEIRDKSKELEIASQHKSQFLANMSHELRTPLNAIIGYSEILQEEVKDLGQDRLTPDLKKIENAGRHLLGLINDILDLSKIEAGRMDVLLEDVEIVPLLEDVRSIIRPLAEKNGNTLQFRLPPQLGIMRTDRTKLKQILLNVLGNAAKFTRDGQLTLAVDRREGSRPMVRFAIADTGIGMTEEQLNRLFLPFSQANTSTMKSYGGTGLGLAITRHFCQLLGGEISATSQRSVGSTFVIALPDSVHAPAHIEPINPRADTEAINDITVLVVDDDPQARDLLAAKLRGQNYRLIHASNGEEALELARQIRPDAITLDVLMPRSDGWAVLSSLKADKELRDIPVVMVTVVQDRGRGLSLGAVDVLTKPVDRSELIALLRRLVLREGPVLVVEDDTSTRAMIRHVVEKLGFAVVEAENGQSALDWLAENPDPAVILLDLIMPEMDGFEFLERLKDQGDENAIPVVVLTGLQITTEERDRLLRQVQKVVAKGLSINTDISAALRDAARRRPVHTAAIAHV